MSINNPPRQMSYVGHATLPSSVVCKKEFRFIIKDDELHSPIIKYFQPGEMYHVHSYDDEVCYIQDRLGNIMNFNIKESSNSSHRRYLFDYFETVGDNREKKINILL